MLHKAEELIHIPDKQVEILKIASEELVKNINNEGYHKYGTFWWTNLECPYAYKYLNLDSMYPPDYFGPNVGHPTEQQSSALYNYMQQVYALLFNRQFNDVLELGTGGGEITSQFHKNNLDYIAIEGTTAGVEKLKSIGIDPDKIVKANLKFFDGINRKFDISMCTEVAEHIEPWFASKIVDNCVRHSDVVWFSAAPGNEPAHYHHINEISMSAWDNIFAHFGFNYSVHLNELISRASRLYLNKNAIDRICNVNVAHVYKIGDE